MTHDDYQKDLYRKVLSFIGYQNVNRNAQVAVKAYLYSEDFDKTAFINSIREEGDALELKTKMEQLKLFYKVDSKKSEDAADVEGGEQIISKDELWAAIEQCITLAEEISVGNEEKKGKMKVDLTRVTELLLGNWEDCPLKKDYANRLNEVFKTCYEQIPVQRASRQILDTFYEKFGNFSMSGAVLKQKVMSRTAIRQFLVVYEEKIATGGLENPRNINRMFRLYANSTLGTAAFDNQFISAFGN